MSKGKKTTSDYSDLIGGFEKGTTAKGAGRPKKAQSANRVKLTTSIDKELIAKAKIEAIKTEQTLADFIEGLLREYFQ